MEGWHISFVLILSHLESAYKCDRAMQRRVLLLKMISAHTNASAEKMMLCQHRPLLRVAARAAVVHFSLGVASNMIVMCRAPQQTPYQQVQLMKALPNLRVSQPHTHTHTHTYTSTHTHTHIHTRTHTDAHIHTNTHTHTHTHIHTQTYTQSHRQTHSRTFTHTHTHTHKTHTHAHTN